MVWQKSEEMTMAEFFTLVKLCVKPDLDIATLTQILIFKFVT